MDQSQDWTGYDYLKLDLHSEVKEPQPLYVEIRDAATRDYWTRVNYETIVPPGASTLVIPVKQLYVGEKSRPGRMLLLNAITRFVLSIGDDAKGPLFVDNIRLESDDSAKQAAFPELVAFDLGLGTSPVMEGFTAAHARDAVQPRPRVWTERCPDLADLRRPAARSALSGFSSASSRAESRWTWRTVAIGSF